MNSFPAVSDTSNEDPIVIFEKTTEFEHGEDGFIEDKYIDSYITEESWYPIWWMMTDFSNP